MRTVDVVETLPEHPDPSGEDPVLADDDNSQRLTPELHRLMRRPDFNTAAWVGLQLELGKLQPLPPRPPDDEIGHEPDAKVGGS
jgi:hypothetical protein